MFEDIKNMIAACEENIVRYKSMGDEKAVKAAEGMIADFKECLKEIKLIREILLWISHSYKKNISSLQTC